MSPNALPKRPNFLAVKSPAKMTATQIKYDMCSEDKSFRSAIVHFMDALNKMPNITHGEVFHSFKGHMQEKAIEVGVPKAVVANFLLILADLGLIRVYRGGAGTKWEFADAVYVEGFLTDGSIEKSTQNVQERHRRTSEIRRLSDNFARATSHFDALEAEILRLQDIAANAANATSGVSLEQLAEAGAIVEDLREQLAIQDREIEALKGDKRQLEERVTDLEGKIEQQKDPAAVAKAMIASMRADK